MIERTVCLAVAEPVEVEPPVEGEGYPLLTG